MNMLLGVLAEYVGLVILAVGCACNARAVRNIGFVITIVAGATVIIMALLS